MPIARALPSERANTLGSCGLEVPAAERGSRSSPEQGRAHSTQNPILVAIPRHASNPATIPPPAPADRTRTQRSGTRLTYSAIPAATVVYEYENVKRVRITSLVIRKVFWFTPQDFSPASPTERMLPLKRLRGPRFSPGTHSSPRHRTRSGPSRVARFSLHVSRRCVCRKPRTARSVAVPHSSFF